MYRILLWLNLSAVLNPYEIGIYKRTWIKYVCLSKVANDTLNGLCCTWEKSSSPLKRSPPVFVNILQRNFRIEICSNQYFGSHLISSEATLFYDFFLFLSLPSWILNSGPCTCYASSLPLNASQHSYMFLVQLPFPWIIITKCDIFSWGEK